MIRVFKSGVGGVFPGVNDQSAEQDALDIAVSRGGVVVPVVEAEISRRIVEAGVDRIVRHLQIVGQRQMIDIGCSLFHSDGMLPFSSRLLQVVATIVIGRSPLAEIAESVTVAFCRDDVGPVNVVGLPIVIEIPAVAGIDIVPDRIQPAGSGQFDIDADVVFDDPVEILRIRRVLIDIQHIGGSCGNRLQMIGCVTEMSHGPRIGDCERQFGSIVQRRTSGKCRHVQRSGGLPTSLRSIAMIPGRGGKVDHIGKRVPGGHKQQNIDRTHRDDAVIVSVTSNHLRGSDGDGIDCRTRSIMPAVSRHEGKTLTKTAKLGEVRCEYFIVVN